MKTTPYPFGVSLHGFALAICLFSFSHEVSSQTPTITVRFANPSFQCPSNQYCVDVEFVSDTLGVEVFGVNFRFFYPDTTLELIGFSDFQGGYGPVSPNPPTVTTSASAGPALFNFVGPADFVNGAIQLVNTGATPLLLDTAIWTKLFQVCFLVNDPNADIDSFCPPIVLDLEQDPANGGFLVGDDGVVITIVDPDPNVESAAVTENVVQFNWMYSGPGTPPFGMPVENECISISCAPMISCPGDVTIECDDSIDTTNTGVPVVVDNCAGDPVITFSDSIIGGPCTNSFTILRTFIASNACQLLDTCVQTIFVTDTTPPTIICPADTTIDCPMDPVFGSVTATDACDTLVILTFVSDTTDGLCASEFSITRTWTATDNCGNSSSCSATITVQDTIAPTIACPSNVIVECSESTLPNSTIPGMPFVVDSCDAQPMVTFSDVTVGSQTCTAEFTITRTFTATDICGNSSTCSQTISVEDNTPPDLTCPVDLTLSCMDTLPSDPAVATDNCSTIDSTSFSDFVCDNPIMGFNGAYNFSNWTITIPPQGGSVTAMGDSQVMLISPNSGGCSNASTMFSIVIPSTGQLIFDWDYTTNDIDGPGFDPFGYRINGTFFQLTDNSGPDTQSGSVIVNVTAGDVFAFSQNSTDCILGAGATTVVEFFACTDQTQEVCTQLVARTHVAIDACGNQSNCIQTIFIIDDVAPVIVCPADTIIDCTSLSDTTTVGSATATDNCDTLVVISFADSTVAGSCPQAFTILRTWTATDNCSNSSTCLQTIVVQDTLAPLLVCPADVTIDCAASTLPNSTSPGMATATDTCDASPEVIFSDIIIASLTCTQEFTIFRTFTATDSCGNSSSCQQVIFVDDRTPPDIICPADMTFECTDTITTELATATDNCSDTVIVGFTDIICTNPVMGFTDEYDVSNWTTTIPPQGGSVTVMGDSEVMLVSPNNGGCSNAATMFSIVIPSTGQLVFDFNYSTNDIDGPSFDPFGYSLNGSFNQLTNNAGSDNQSGTVSLSVNAGDVFAFTQVSTDCIFGAGATTVVEFFACVGPVEGEVGCSQLVIRTFSATDECGNTSNCIQTLFIEDTTPPTIVCPADTILSFTANTSPDSIGVASATDSCTAGLPVVTFDDVIVESLCDSSFTIQRTFTASDACGNSSTCLQVIEIIGSDTFELVLDAIACIDHINLSIDNDCGTIVMSGIILTGDLGGDNSFTVIIKDENGNIIPNATFTYEHVGQTFTVMVLSECTGQSCWGTVTVEDKVGPIIDCVCPSGNEGDSCEISCLQIAQFLAGDIPSELQPTVVDNCGGATIEVVDVDLSFETCTGGFVLVTYEATDAFGNTSSCVQEFTIVPLTLDSLVFPADFIGECNGSSDPSVTGWPTVDGLDLSNIPGHCNILATYTDLVIPLCGGGIKIVRTFTVFDWCVPTKIEFVQFITLMDRTGPVLTCPVDMVIGTDVWNCSANVVIPRPTAVDACSDIKSFQLVYEEGVVLPVGNTYRVSDLSLGTHTFTWTVTDECHNSSTCSFDITVIDNVPPVPSCKQHLIVSLTNDRPNGITIVSANVFDDGSFDNCSAVSFRARRMDSCIDFNWTTGGACVDDIPGGVPAVNGKDFGTDPGICVPFSCCDLGSGPVMVELEVTDAAGNVNYCMVEVQVQDKLPPTITCPPDITLSCEFEFDFDNIEGSFTDAEGNANGSLDEDPLSEIFGNVYDAFSHLESVRRQIVINDIYNDLFPQPHNFGIEGWASDNCEVNLKVVVSVFEDCSGSGLPGTPPPGAVKLITRRFIASDASGNQSQNSCVQRIWVIDFDPFFITDTTCTNENPLDGVIWPCDVLLSTCPDELTGTGVPIIFDDQCSIIGLSFEDTRFDFADGSCYKILREWSIIDWCQFNADTGEGLYSYTQEIKVLDATGPLFLNCPQAPVSLCLDDPGVSLPDNNQVFLGANNPNASSCSVHVTMSQRVRELCSQSVVYDVKLYPFNGNEFIQLKGLTVLQLDANHEGDLSFNTEESTMQSISEDGLPYTDPLCNDFHRLVWTVTDGCGNISFCEYLLRLEDCKDPTPVCINGLSTVIMPAEGEVTIWASDFNASSFDDCTSPEDLLFSFSGTTYEPSFTYTCDNVPVFGVPIEEEIWAADGGTDQNCNGQIEWSERNKDLCITFIIITDNDSICDEQGTVLVGEIMTDHTDAISNVIVNLSGPQGTLPGIVTSTDGRFSFANVPPGFDYTLKAERNDDHRNGVSTLDLVRIQKHLLGKELFGSAYQYIAADANNSGSISAIDLIEIRKLILGLYPVYPSNQSWRFIKEGSAMAEGHPWPIEEVIEIDNFDPNQAANVDFVGVKIGDVNNTVKANALQILPREGRSVLQVNAISNGEQNPGELIEVRFVLPEITSGFQWTLETKGLEFVSIGSKDIPIDETNLGILENGIITISWNGEPIGKDFTKEELSFVIKFRVTEKMSLDAMLDITNTITAAEAYTLSGDIKDVKLVFDDSKSFTDFALYQNRPNPWNGQTLVGFDLPVASQATLTVYDVAGRVLKTISGEYKVGYNTIMLTTRDLPGSGILYYRLESGGYSATKKMMIIQ